MKTEVSFTDLAFSGVISKLPLRKLEILDHQVPIWSEVRRNVFLSLLHMGLNTMHNGFSVNVFHEPQVSHVGLSALLSGRFGETIEHFKCSLYTRDPNEKEALSQALSAIEQKAIENRRFIHPDSQLHPDE